MWLVLLPCGGCICPWHSLHAVPLQLWHTCSTTRVKQIGRWCDNELYRIQQLMVIARWSNFVTFDNTNTRVLWYNLTWSQRFAYTSCFDVMKKMNKKFIHVGRGCLLKPYPLWSIIIIVMIKSAVNNTPSRLLLIVNLSTHAHFSVIVQSYIVRRPNLLHFWPTRGRMSFAKPATQPTAGGMHLLPCYQFNVINNSISRPNC